MCVRYVQSTSKLFCQEYDRKNPKLESLSHEITLLRTNIHGIRYQPKHTEDF